MLALHVRVICHDGAQGSSLLKSLQLAKRLLFLDSAGPFDPASVVTGTTLCQLSLGGGRAYVAPSTTGHRSSWSASSFRDWWQQAVLAPTVTLDSATSVRRSSRRDLTLWLANQDGGAHVDSSVDKDYDELRRATPLTLVTRRPPAQLSTPIPLALGTAMRQIAHELLRTLEPITAVEPPLRADLYTLPVVDCPRVTIEPATPQ